MKRRRSAATSGRLRISSIHIYPIKSCAGISLQKSSYNRLGFTYDRSFMLINTQTHQHLSQREYPRLALVIPKINEQEQTLTISFRDHTDINDTITVPLQPNLLKDEIEESHIRVWNDEFTGYIFTSPIIGAWFSRVLNLRSDRSISLACIHGVEKHIRPFQVKYDRSDPKMKIHPPLSDQAPFLLTTSASLEKVNTWTNHDGKKNNNERPGRLVTMAAFRPSIVVDGHIHAFDEDTWKKIIFRKPKKVDQINDTTSSSSSSSSEQTFWVAKACPRCILTTVDPSVGKFHPSGEPLLSLREHRRIFSNIPSEKDSAMFGQFLLQCQTKGEIEVGDEIEVIQFKPHVHDPGMF